MKKSILLGLLTTVCVGLTLSPLNVKADELVSEDLVLVDSKSETMDGGTQYSSINCNANLSKSGGTFVATSTTSRAMDSIWTKANSYTSGRQLLNSDQNTVYSSTYGSAQVRVGILPNNTRARGYHTYKKSGYKTIELVTSYNW
ncbi:hypothetical protein [Enterococcus faecalis]|uniref:hypothetical protein n=1 Tax=Enterococcus faecalis TaxID=1351 RepID=UPI002DBE9586|nr:hypothetical protein [Enterococcus faecalis]MEB7792078.1 hypothetical protein [Enterococcus faecalis]MEB7810066.1 hypothetical protein [Enterococcus faecalis]